ncbi:MAG: 4-(cytidine 5'-diphospho)-2-C-methyl-D-erythritol kinase [Armatimonadetes bacterium]|nr:4-(cytidine 5'-diphospho)-2-C-methyl-D-erythritol kinase [Armatimonadota bacterium]
MNVNATPLTLSCYAKVNLALDVYGTRPDGFHDIDTVFYEIDLADTLEVASTPGSFDFKLEEGIAPSGADNLVVKAAHALPGCSGVSQRLWKRIPVEAGLGSGSSDAASALRAAAHFSQSSQNLRHLAATLGSDVAFFLEGGCARGRGRGEELAPVRTRMKLHFLIVKPDVGVPTGWAYRELDKAGGVRKGHFAARMAQALESGDSDAVPGLLGNDFEMAVFSRFPEIADLKARLERAGARGALLCGSGSAVFGIFPTREAAERATEDFSDVWRAVASGLPERSAL